MSKDISIITVNYNNALGLQKTMQSVFSQSCKNIEYIIIDGGSTDGSREVIEKESENITQWVSELDTGIYNAMNKGIRLSSGKYLLFLNSGDYFAAEDVCEKMINKVDESVDIIYGNVDVMLADGTETKFIAPEKLTIDYLLAGSLFHPATFIKKRLFDEYGLYDETLSIVADWAFCFKVIVAGSARCLHKSIAVSVFHKDGISSKQESMPVIKKERAKIIKQNLPVVVESLLDERNDLLRYNNDLKLALRSRKNLFKQLCKRLLEDISPFKK